MAIEFYLPPTWPGVGAVTPKKTAAGTKSALTKALTTAGTQATFGAMSLTPMTLGELRNALFFDSDNGFSITLCSEIVNSTLKLDRSGFLVGQSRLQWLRREKRRVISELMSCAVVLTARCPANSYVASCADLNLFFQHWAAPVWEKLWPKDSGPDYVICVSQGGSRETATFVEVKGRSAAVVAQPAGSHKVFSAQKTQSMNARFRPEFAPAFTRHVLCYVTIAHSQVVAFQTFNHDFPEPARPRCPTALPVAFSQFVRQLLNTGLEDAAKLLIDAPGVDVAFVEEQERALVDRLRLTVEEDFSLSSNGAFWRQNTSAPERLLIADAAISVFVRIRLLLGSKRKLKALQVMEELQALNRPGLFASSEKLVGRSPVGTAIEIGRREKSSQRRFASDGSFGF